ncbi:hypothetical protein RT717_20135 [Imperialibacter roseus]|uniref:DUF4595 domain-containing protein n=1 Tax=Imperialibacter roseus TaxID=1324217 RepID=A0ABZ0ILR9_9BACT|nr:hypothetical protein [Imperialibacter roseus]WOK05393.1 hypothetical protein RT717_20135 [Imperialibacter roseus]
MKVKFLNFFAATALVGMFAACSGDDDALPGENENPGSQKASIKLSFNPPPLFNASERQPAYAVIAMTDNNEVEVVSNKKVALSLKAGSYFTEAFEIPSATYRLSSFVVFNAEDKVVLATPQEGSLKGEELQMGLPLVVDGKAGGTIVANTEVGQVFVVEDAADFGYAVEVFGGKSDEVTLVSFSASVNVGGFVYDGIKPSVLITATDDEGNSWSVGRDIEGVENISIPTRFDNYYITWTHWGDVYERELTREELFEKRAVKLEGQKAPKRLKSETEYMLLAEGSKLESHVDYIYNEEGKLARRDFYHFNHDTNEWVLQLITWYEYKNGRLDNVKRTMDNTLLDTQQYYYRSDGKVSKVVQTGLNGGQEAVWLYNSQTDAFTGIRYSFDNGNFFTYYYEFDKGNIVSEYSGVGSTTGTSSSQKHYDSFINPHYLLGITDYFLRESSKNNLNGQTQSYAGSFPIYVPGQYTYTYQSGYPMEKQVKYVGYQNPTATYTSKTVYEYEN